jgi:gliding motility-associated-like protein
MNRINLILLFLVIMDYNNFYAAGLYPIKQVDNDKNWNFIENKGQLIDCKGNLLTNIKYYCHSAVVNIYCKPGVIDFSFRKKATKKEDISEASGFASKKDLKKCQNNIPDSISYDSKIIAYRTELILLNSNQSAQIISSEQQEYYENYYLAYTKEKGITNVRTFKTVIYKDIYPYIDLILHTKKMGMKYEFVVYPGGNVNDIKMQWIGVQNIRLTENGGIIYTLRLGKMTESAPVYIQWKKKVKGSFNINHRLIGFNIKSYDKSKILIIDPILNWATYFGGGGTDYGSAVAADSFGNVYTTGNTTSYSGISTKGSYQDSISGSSMPDAYLAKFNSNGKLLWATYIGGTGYDGGVSIAIQGGSSIYIAGSTSSKSGIATGGAYKISYNGGSRDVFVIKFSDQGIRKWGTYFGGPGYEECNHVIADVYGDIFITGETSSESGIATSGAHQTNSGSSATFTVGDAYLAKFNSNGNIIWATYYGYNGSSTGRNGATKGNNLATDRSGNVFISGFTQSSSGIATNGAFQSTDPGTFYLDNCGFLAKFNTGGQLQWGTYYGNNNTIIWGLATDYVGNVYFGGITNDTIISTIGVHQAAYRGKSDGFFVKFSTLGTQFWATYYGGESYDAIRDIVVDHLGNIYISGVTNSISGIATAGAWQSDYKISSNMLFDAFIARFNNKGNCLWGTYFGQDIFYTDMISSDNCGNLYLLSTCQGNAALATKDAHQTTFGGGISDAFLVRFNLLNYDAGIDSITKPSGDFCKDSAQVSVVLHNFGNHVLDSVKIAVSVNGKIQSIYSWKGSLLPDSAALVTIGNTGFPSGKDTIKAWTFEPDGSLDSFPFNDTILLVINVYRPPKAAFNISSFPYIFEKKPVNFQNKSSNALFYQWYFGNSDSSNLNSPDYTYQDPGIYKVILVASGNKSCPYDTAFEVININSGDAKIYIPNVFSPNGDSINDVFDLSGFAIKSYSFDIFNRWDEHIYHGSANLDNPIVGLGLLSSGAGWDGTYKGADAPIGLYIYQFDVIDINGSHHKLRGKFTLVR